MAAAIPDGTVISILIVAIIILAILWNDTLSTGSSSSSSSTDPSSTSPKDSDEGGDGTSRRDPTVTVREQVDHANGAFKLKASAEAYGDAEITRTGFIKISHYPTGKTLVDTNSPEQSEYTQTGSRFEVENSGIGLGVIRYTAWTKDSKGNTATYTDDFEIEPSDERPREDLDIDIEYGDGPELESDILDLLAEYLEDMIKFKKYILREVQRGVTSSDKLLYGFCYSYYNENSLDLDHKPIDIMKAMKALSLNLNDFENEIDNLEPDLIREYFGSLRIDNKADLLKGVRNIETVFAECNTQIKSEDLPEL
jgi:hypothetical protein